VPDAQFGNGILTAEELLFCGLRAPRLVVLSACLTASGLQSASGGILGWRTAFCAVGAENMLMSIWEVDDFAGAVLMDAFYDALRTMAPDEALAAAQRYLRSATVGELRRRRWLDAGRLRRIGAGMEDVRRILARPETSRPFAHPRYWSGYVLLR